MVNFNKEFRCLEVVSTVDVGGGRGVEGGGGWSGFRGRTLL